MKTPSIVALMLAVGGCAVLSNITPIGDGAFMAAAHSNDVNARVEDQRARAMEQAAAYCKEHGGAVDIIRIVAAAPPFGQPPSAEVDFRCKTAL
jgi:uncharacterized membrane protein YgdD (TMEM256/DUF423 family)